MSKEEHSAADGFDCRQAFAGELARLAAADPRIRVLRLQENRGRGIARAWRTASRQPATRAMAATWAWVPALRSSVARG